ncbi:MAG: 1-phosphofructokinase family hexose kinase [Verrucomicrobiae bacterium]|nr:1-phosphofructokinase family hexose kinase [Verrucomicrobiae bacterium]
MILTLTLNPCIDLEVEVRRLVRDDINRIVARHREAAGKGINVSRVVQALGGRTLAIAPIGGHMGMDFLNRFTKTRIRAKLVPIAGETRVNINIHEPHGRAHTRLNAPGPRLTARELHQVIDAVDRNLPRTAVLVLSGSLPPGVPADTYAEIIRLANRRGVRVILDTDGEPLRLGLRARPFMVKPNVHETRRLLGGRLETTEAVARAAQRLVKMGAEVAVISRGPLGAVMTTAKERWSARSPSVPRRNNVGPGDCLTGAFALALVRGLELPEALRWGVAAGAACVASSPENGCGARLMRRLLPRVKLRKV